MTPNLQKIRSFIAICDYGSFRRAAEELHLSQPALTKHVQDLEEAVGLPLLNRTTRSLRLTKGGEVFRNRMSRLLDEMNGVIRDLQEEASLERGHISVACVPTIASTVLPAILAAFSRKHPRITVHVRDEMSESLEQRILDHEADFGIGPAPERAGSLDFRFIVRDRFVAVFDDSHPMAGRDEVDIRELTDFDLVAISFGNVRSMVDNALRRAGIDIAPKYEALYPQTLARMIDEGLGFGILPSMTVSGTSRPGLHTVRLRRPKIYRDIGLISRKGWVPNPACESLIEEVDRYMPADERS